MVIFLNDRRLRRDSNLNFGTRPRSDNIDSHIRVVHDEKYGGGVVVGFTAPFLTVQKLFQLPRVVAILNSGNQPTSGNVGSVMNVSGLVAKCCCSRWNRITRSLRSIVRPIFTSGFGAGF